MEVWPIRPQKFYSVTRTMRRPLVSVYSDMLCDGDNSSFMFSGRCVVTGSDTVHASMRTSTFSGSQRLGDANYDHGL